MTIEAETLVQLATALKNRGMNRMVDIHFMRAPYRRNHLWTCTIDRKTPANPRRGLRA